VIIATGLFQKPKVPSFSAGFPPEVLQISASGYRRADALPPGAVLVIGSGQSGCQIAEELNDSGRKVYLSVGRAGRLPRRYRGRDGFEWLDVIGFISRTTEMLPSPAARFGPNPHLTGRNGGHTINLYQFYKDGIGLLGHLSGIQDGIIQITPDLMESLAKADKFERTSWKIDKTILKLGFSDPPEELPVLADGFSSPLLTTLNVKEADNHDHLGVRLFFDFGMVKFPVFDDFGFPVTARKDPLPRLFFLACWLLASKESGLLLGVGDDAASVAEEICFRQ
jgi:putative flavoprotein involved in K+ transport